MHSEEKDRFFSLNSFLFMLSLVYGAVVQLRTAGYERELLGSRRLPCKVISVGNITVGGTGKTPLTVYLAERVRRYGYRVAVISRGYKGGAEKGGGIVSNGQEIVMSPEKAGDEPFMMAHQLKSIEIPVIVGRNRFEAGMLAVSQFDSEVIILDDAFQHMKIKRDLNLVLLDSQRPFGNKHLLPRGILREPISSLSRSDAFVLTRSDPASASAKPDMPAPLQMITARRPVYRIFYVPYVHKMIKGQNSKTPQHLTNSYLTDIKFLKDKKVFAFCGIGNNDDFKRTVESIRCELRNFIGFPDHHRYSERDIQSILRSAADTKAQFLITTEKDYARIAHRVILPLDLVIIGIHVCFGDDEAAFDEFIKTRLSRSEKQKPL